MSIIPSASSLHRVLAADAALCLVAGLALAGAAGLGAGILGLPTGLLRGAGLVLLPVAFFVAWLARRPSPPRRAVVALVVLNGAWVMASLVLLWSGWIAPTAVGAGFILAQAALVAAFALLEARALNERYATVVGGRLKRS